MPKGQASKKTNTKKDTKVRVPAQVHYRYAGPFWCDRKRVISGQLELELCVVMLPLAYHASRRDGYETCCVASWLQG